MGKSRKKLKLLDKEVAEDVQSIKSARQVSEAEIKKIIEFLNTVGKYRRVKPCDMDDPEDNECPAPRDF